MRLRDVKQLRVGYEVLCGPFSGRVTCVDLVDDDRVVIKWDSHDSEDVIAEQSPLWLNIKPALGSKLTCRPNGVVDG